MKRFLLALILGSIVTSLQAQDDATSKLSATTQMFLDEISGNGDVEHGTKAPRRLGLKPVDGMWKGRGKHAGRLYAAPDTLDGRAYIAAYLRLGDAASRSEVEALGVVLQEEFDNGLFTSLIPVDKLNDVAAVGNVKRVNVSPLKRPLTYKARQATNVDDALTLSADAIAAGLRNKYDGTGVILGVIDNGIDFNHIAFKDASGNSRIKQAYVYNGSRATTYTGSTITSTLTDDKTEDHGTHTASTAGGSSVKVSGSTVSVTDDHANATYGGMAPGADLYLAGINGLASTYLDNAVKNMCTYADQQGKPLVVSNSWGSQFGPHDGTGDEADVYNALFGDSHPGRVALFAASNDGGKSKDGEGGGYHVSATASSSNPLSTIVRAATYSNTDAGYYYQGLIANAWARSTSVSKLGIKILVLDASTGEVKTSVTKTSSGTVSGLSNYYSGTLYVYYDQVTSDKTQLILYSSDGIESQGVTSSTKDGETYYKSKYTLAIQVYPTSGSSVVDVWGGTYGYFTSHLTTSGYAWKAGSDDMCVSDEAMMPSVISVGAYVTANTWTDYSGAAHSMADEYTVGDIAYFSSYATAAESPDGQQYPWITAPGARIVAAINHNHTKSVDSDYSYWGDYFITDLVVNNSSNPYAAMEGTSMATPVAAGIVALWMQAAQEAGRSLTVNDVKEIMKETAISDAYTIGTNASHFGQGKIDALAGIRYILGASAEPTIKVQPAELEFSGYATQQQTQTIAVTGRNLEADISVSISGSSEFSVDKMHIAQTDGVAEDVLTVAWTPTEVGTQTADITLTSSNAESVTITLTGNAEAATPTIIASADALDFSARLDEEQSRTFTVSGRFITGETTIALTDANGVFAVSPMALTADEVAAGAEVTVTFASAVEGNFAGSVILAAEGAELLVINLTAAANDGGTASDPYLNIARYATIDDAGWNTTYVNTLYKYTEYEDEEVAWLTMPVYGAWVGVYYNSHPQAWIQTDVTDTSNKYAGTTWSSSDVLLGSSPYFTASSGNGSARVMGYNSRNNRTQESVTFYVTNTTAVKLLGLGQSRASSSYPASLAIYECTLGDDGTPVASASALQRYTNSATSGTFILSATDLDATKVYKVVAATYRSYIAEIAFQTPLPKPSPVIHGDINGDGEVTVADATALVNIILGKETRDGSYDQTAADINGDGAVTIADVTALVNLILGK